MSNKAAAASHKRNSPDDVSADAKETDARHPVAQADVTFIGDEEARLAGERIFRLHARLFEELAK